MVDAIGFQHISGERLLHVGSADSSASAFQDIRGPATVSVSSSWLLQPIQKVTSAHCGVLKHGTKDGRVVFTIPKLGYGDMIRLDP